MRSPFVAGRLALGVVLAIATALANAADLTVGVASNFAATMPRLATAFEASSGYTLRTSVGSTGKLYAQIVNGAPFDVMLAADTRRPALLVSAGLAVAESRFTYATGRLVVWSRDPALTDCRVALSEGLGKIAIANPATAPYGEAARSTLLALDLWEAVAPRLVTGESIGQTLHFAASGNASLGFVAAAQLTSAVPEPSCQWHVPSHYHARIEQQAVLLTGARNARAAHAFLMFLRSDEARRIVASAGYGGLAAD